ncbi:hypothetical protein WMY93_033584 [Mugilogobius chulae]|uniref:Uncharacterized protein n=1 Tax=Mugilogobius chulae TaxID=88201 RepID=A0AAW0MSD4_9GOBI
MTRVTLAPREANDRHFLSAAATSCLPSPQTLCSSTLSLLVLKYSANSAFTPNTQESSVSKDSDGDPRLVMFICCSPDVFRKLMVEFRSADLPHEQYVFFYIDVFGDSLNSEPRTPWSRGDDEDAIAKDAFQVKVQTQTTRTPSLRTLFRYKSKDAFQVKVQTQTTRTPLLKTLFRTKSKDTFQVKV